MPEERRGLEMAAEGFPIASTRTFTIEEGHRFISGVQLVGDDTSKAAGCIKNSIIHRA